MFFFFNILIQPLFGAFVVVPSSSFSLSLCLQKWEYEYQWWYDKNKFNIYLMQSWCVLCVREMGRHRIEANKKKYKWAFTLVTDVSTNNHLFGILRSFLWYAFWYSTDIIKYHDHCRSPFVSERFRFCVFFILYLFCYGVALSFWIAFTDWNEIRSVFPIWSRIVLRSFKWWRIRR